MSDEPSTVAKLDELLTAIQGYGDPRRAAGEWKQAYKLLQATALPQSRVTHVVAMRDLAGLKEFIAQLRAPAAPAATASDEAEFAETCRKAMKAFRKRLELTVLDEESKLGRGPLSKGAGAGVPAIIPPSEWPEDVWQELVRQGRLRYIGHGFYELTRQEK